MKILLIIVFLAQINVLAGQTLIDSTRHQGMPSAADKKKVVLASGMSVVGYVGSLYLLNKQWYANYPRSSFHAFNDNREWQQVDKIGHLWTAYQTSRALSSAWKWTGVKENKAIWIGTLSGFSYMTVIELLDAYSEAWGWSWGDITANFTGASLFAFQQLIWKEQKMQIKFSAHKNAYSSELATRANFLYGNTLSQRLLKDYNAQTYWLSFKLSSLLSRQKLPPWLNLAVGYGAAGMFGAAENIGYDKNGQVAFDRRDIPRYRQWYLSPDVDWTKIRTRNKTLRTVFFLLNCVKLPAPALELSNRKWQGHWLLF